MNKGLGKKFLLLIAVLVLALTGTGIAYALTVHTLPQTKLSPSQGWVAVTQAQFQEGVINQVDISGWPYRKPVTITNSGAALTDYQVKVDVPYDPHMQEDFDDIRFADGNGNSLSHWRESYTASTSAVFWVKVPSIPTGNSTIYMHYGDESASSTSDGEATFVFFDDFESGNLNKWTVVTDTFWTIATDQKRSGTYSLKAGSTSTSNKYIVATGVDESDLVYDSWWYATATTPDIASQLRAQNTTPYNDYHINWEGQWSIAKYVNSTWTRLNAVSGTLPQNTWFKATILIKGSPGQMKFLLDDVQINPVSGWVDVGTDHTSGTVGQRAWTANNDWWIDDVRARKYADPEPTATIGAEEELSLCKVELAVKSDWYDTSWSYRKKITTNHTKVAGNLTDFPLLVSLVSDSDLASDAQNDGDDILFTKSDGTTKLAHEIEKFNGTTGELVTWVRVASLSSSTDTEIYMYYGNATCGSQQNATGVWDSNFKMVQHLQETDIDGGSGDIKDSTSNGNNGTTLGMDSADQVAGKIDGSLDFDGINDYINTTSNESKTASNITWEVWFKADLTTGSHHILWEGPASQNGWGEPGVASSHEMHLTIGRMSTANLLDFFYGYEYTSGNWVPAVEIQTSFSDTTSWHYAVVVLTGAGSSPAGELFLDGVSQGNDTGIETDRSGWDTNLRIGRCGAAQRYLDGIADEVRISNIARSAAWIKTCYNNQNSTSTFYSLDSEETAWYDTSWSYRKKITINSSQVEADLDNFPVLINTIDDDFKHVAKSDGGDIRFTKSDGISEIPRGIEYFNKSAGELVAWVKVDVKGGSDVDIYVYYGNPDASEPAANSTYGSEKVWDGNFKMVQHLQEDPTDPNPAFKDSTSNDNDGSNWGSMTSSDQVIGQIDGSIDFDGINDRIYLGSIGTLSNNTFSISVWVKVPNAWPRQEMVWGAITGTSDERFRFEVYDTWINFHDDYNMDTWTSSGTIEADKWYHVVATYDYPNQKASIYLNGEFKASDTSFSQASNALGALQIGSRDGAYYINGTLDEVRISNSAASADWIKTCYNNQGDPSTFYSLGSEQYVASGTIASKVYDTGEAGASWDWLSWNGTVEAGVTDITFEVRASDTAFAKDNATLPWQPASALPITGRYQQWRATLTTSDTSVTPVLHEVRVLYS